MIKERCLLDLLEEEKKAVSDYNSLIDNYEFIISHYTELSKEHPEIKEYCDRELNDRLSKNKELEKLAMQKITSVRLEIKKYLSILWTVQESKVYSLEEIDVELLCEDVSKIAIKCIDSIKEYGWTENVTDFIERELLELYGVKREV